MGLAKIEERYTTVLKDYKRHPDGQTRWEREVFAYKELSWATPELICSNPRWLEVERLTPILSLSRDQSIRYKKPLRELLQAVHEAGWWHGDCVLVNVVVHPTRGPLLIDWEGLSPAVGSVSYDLYGAHAAGVEPGWKVEGGDGVSWRGPWDVCPGKYWG